MGGTDCYDPAAIFVSFTPNGSEAHRRRNPRWNKLWGEVHPNLIDDRFLRRTFADWPRLLTSVPYICVAMDAAELRRNPPWAPRRRRADVCRRQDGRAALAEPALEAEPVQRLARHLATNGAILLCGLASGVLSARLLAPDGRGALAAVLFWPQLITSLGLLSLPGAMIFRRGRPDVDRAAVAATGAWLALGLSAIGRARRLPGAAVPAARASAASLAQVYLLAFVPFNFLALASLALDQGDMRFARYNLTRLLPSGVYLVSLLLLWALDAVSVATLVWASWLGTALTAVVCLYQSRDDLRARPSLLEARRLVASGARLHGAALLAVLLAQADRFVVVTFWDDATLGLYVIALTFAGAGLDVVTGAFNVLLLPRLAAARDTGAQRRIMGQTLRYATLLLTAGTAVLLLLCPWLLPFLFGDCLHGRGRDLPRVPRRLSADRAAAGHHLRAVRNR